MTCKWNGRGEPRVLAGRHDELCNDQACRGCQPCAEPHCRVCGVTHADGTCAECMAETRESLRDIARMCDALPAEVEHRGVNGEAMMLLGPSADPEARGHLEASVLAGRVPADYLDAADGELHPLFVLGGWDAIWRETLEHDEPSERLTVGCAVAYLDSQLTYMGGYEHVPFEDFAAQVHACKAHLQAVLNDRNQGDRANVGCFDCSGDLERRLTTTGFEDHWTCKRCKRRYTQPEYNFALRAKLEAGLEETA